MCRYTCTWISPASVSQHTLTYAHMHTCTHTHTHTLSLSLSLSLSLKAATHDPAEEIREKMVGHVFDLLYQRPEQEKQLLAQLVNKLGDPHRKVASKTVMFLLKLCEL